MKPSEAQSNSQSINLIIWAVRRQLNEAQQALREAERSQATAEGSWSLRKELVGFKGVGVRGQEEVTFDARIYQEVSQGYKTQVAALEQQVKYWDNALSLTLSKFLT